MGGFGFLHFEIDVANPDLPTALLPWADGEEPPNLLFGVFQESAALWGHGCHAGTGTLWKIHLLGPLHLKKSGGTGGPITMYLTFLSSVGPRCLTTGSCNQPEAAMSNWLKD